MSVEQASIAPETETSLHSRFMSVATELSRVAAMYYQEDNEIKDRAIWCDQTMVYGGPGLLVFSTMLERAAKVLPYEVDSAHFLIIGDGTSDGVHVNKSTESRATDYSVVVDILEAFEDYTDAHRAEGTRDCRTGFSPDELAKMSEFGLSFAVNCYIRLQEPKKPKEPEVQLIEE